MILKVSVNKILADLEQTISAYVSLGLEI